MMSAGVQLARVVVGADAALAGGYPVLQSMTYVTRGAGECGVAAVDAGRVEAELVVDGGEVVEHLLRAAVVGADVAEDGDVQGVLLGQGTVIRRGSVGTRRDELGATRESRVISAWCCYRALCDVA